MTDKLPYRRHLKDLQHTAGLAEALAARLGGGEVLALEGDVGAGKTSFTRELTRALGCARLANSPTFALFQRYRGGRLPVLHGDFYRLAHPQELEELGWQEMLDEMSGGLVVVEWADRFPQLLPSDALRMIWRLGEGEQQREVELVPHGPRSAALVAGLREAEALP
jgi:tRNA threonylcarbamoyladenosine biosynthesis protein TsaE